MVWRLRELRPRARTTPRRRLPELAEDVTQETFLTALNRIEDFDPDRGAMLPWLPYMARNCARKAYSGDRQR